MLTNAAVKKAFQVALNRLAQGYAWDAEMFDGEILAAFDDNNRRKLLREKSREASAVPFVFNAHVWYALLDYAKVMPDRTIVFKFRNGKREIVSLDE